MEALEKLLAEGDLLSRVVCFELNRSGDNGQKISISVHEFLTGEHRGQFCAEPTDPIRQCKTQYLGVGDSIEEALKNCLENIKGVSMAEILDTNANR